MKAVATRGSEATTSSARRSNSRGVGLNAPGSGAPTTAQRPLETQMIGEPEELQADAIASAAAGRPAGPPDGEADPSNVAQFSALRQPIVAKPATEAGPRHRQASLPARLPLHASLGAGALHPSIKSEVVNQPVQRQLAFNVPGHSHEQQAGRAARGSGASAHTAAEPIALAAAPFDDDRGWSPPVGRHDDPNEAEADRLARGTRNGESLSARAVGSSGASIAAPPALGAAIDAARGEARPLPAPIRAEYGRLYDFDFSKVRLHAGAGAANAARLARAQAFAFGGDLYFGERHYSPDSESGRDLLAHELAHVALDSRALGAPILRRRGPDVPSAPVVTPGPAAQTAPALVPVSPNPKTPPASETPPTKKAAPEKPEPLKEIIERSASNAPAVLGGTAAAKADAPPPADKDIAGAAVQMLQASGGLANVDDELGEHKRWSKAGAAVGAAGSGQRAAFIAYSALSEDSFAESAAKGALMGAGTKLLEKGFEKGALKFATSMAARYGAVAASKAPIPAVGAVIAGVMAAYSLSQRDWRQTGATIGKFGKGEGKYDTLANSLESISTSIEVASEVLNLIAGIIGAISIAMWAITVATVGVAAPLAGTLSTIAGGIALVTLVLDAINSVIIKGLITVFRSLHAYSSTADPRDVVKEGAAIGDAAGAMTGFVGGFAGGLAGGHGAEKGLGRLGARLKGKSPPSIPDHVGGGEAPGSGPSVEAAAKETPSKPAEPAKPPAEPVKAEQPAEPTRAGPPEPVKAPELEAAKAKALEAADGGGGKGADGGGSGGSGSGAGGDGKGGGKKPGKPVPEPATPREPSPGDVKLTAAKRKRLAQLAAKDDLTPQELSEVASMFGVTVDQLKRAMIRGGLETSVDEAAAMSTNRGRDPILDQATEPRTKLTKDEYLRQQILEGKLSPDKDIRGEEQKNWHRVAADVREQSAENFRRSNEEAAADISQHTGMTLRSLENVEAHGREYVPVLQGEKVPDFAETRGTDYVERAVESGDPSDVKSTNIPAAHDESHVLTVKNEPEYAAKNASYSEDKIEHGDQTHAGDVTADLELMDQRRPEPRSGFQHAESKPGPGVWKESAELVKRYAKQAEQLEKDRDAMNRRAANLAKRGKTAEAAEATAKAAKLDEELRSALLNKQKAEQARPVIGKLVSEASPEARRDLGRGPPKSKATPPSPAAPVPASPTPPAPATPAPVPVSPTPPALATPSAVAIEPAPIEQKPQVTAPSEAPPSSSAPANTHQTEPPAPPTRVRVATPDQPPPEPGGQRVRIADAEKSGEAERDVAAAQEAQAAKEAEAETQAERSAKRYLPPLNMAGAVGRSGAGKGGGPKTADAGREKSDEKKEPGWGEKISKTARWFALDPELIGKASEEAQQGFEEARRKPFVKNVNPDYPPPPCTPQQIVEVRREIAEASSAREQSQAASQAMAGEAAKAKANEKPLNDLGASNKEAQDAARDHEGKIEKGSDAAKKQEKGEADADKAHNDFESKKARLATVTVPMRAFAGFTSLAHSLPDSPDVLVSAKRGILSMNADCTKFLGQLDQMEQALAEQKAGGAARKAEVADKNAAFDATAEKVRASKEELATGGDKTTALTDENKTEGAAASKLRDEADANARTLAAQEQAKTGQAATMASSLNEWAQTHKAARKSKIDSTIKELTDQDYEIRAVHEL